MQEIQEFLVFFLHYILSRFMGLGKRFETVKNLAVAILIAKRGKYSSSFLNTSFFLLVVTAIIAGPIIAENNPFISAIEYEREKNNYDATVVEYNPYEQSVGTDISNKGRDKVVAYTVQGGDTLAGIAKKFQVNTDTIKWENDLKSDSIKPGQKLDIPPGIGIVHKVVSGDNIYNIAKKYKADAQTIVNWPFNEFGDYENFTLVPGQTIFVPNGIPEQAQPLQNPNYSAIAQIQAGVKGTSNFIWPTSGAITQYPIWYHMALDIANASAPPVLAADTGTVVYSDCINWGYGCHIIIDHGNGYQTLYGHLQRRDVEAGQTVSQGQQIGQMGSTGRSTGTHLHFEIRTGGQLLNPLNFLK